MKADVNIGQVEPGALLSSKSRKWPGSQAYPTGGPPTLALFGNFGIGNWGNEGSLRAMVDFLSRERPEARLFCVCPNPSVVQREFGIVAISIRSSSDLKGVLRTINRIFLRIPGKIRDLAKAFCQIRSADLMIIPGTGILDDFGERPQGVPLDIFLWCLAARIAGTRVAFVSIGAGPIRHPVSKWLMVSAAKLANYRSYRDIISRDFLKNAGVNVEKDKVYPDIAFNLTAPEGRAPAPLGSGRLTVGLGVMKYRGWYGYAVGGQPIFDAYIDKLARFVVHLLAAGHRVKLFTGDTSDNEALEVLMTRLQKVAAVPLENSVFTEPAQSLHDLMKQMSGTDIVVATRFHNIVCALKTGKPTISLGYSKKNDDLMAAMGLGEYCQHVETFTNDVLNLQFADVVAKRRKLEDVINDGNLAIRKLLELAGEVSTFRVSIEVRALLI